MELSHKKTLPLLQEAKDKLKDSETIQELCNEYEVDVDFIDLVPMAFTELDVSARTDKACIYFNEKLYDNFLDEHLHYAAHELIHFFQQAFGDGPTEGSADDDYLDNEYEKEGFQVQTEFISETEGDEAAEEYIEQVMDHHDVPENERSKRKKDLLNLAHNVYLKKKSGLLKAPKSLLYYLEGIMLKAIHSKLGALLDFVLNQNINPKFREEYLKLLEICQKYISNFSNRDIFSFKINKGILYSLVEDEIYFESLEEDHFFNYIENWQSKHDGKPIEELKNVDLLFMIEFNPENDNVAGLYAPEGKALSIKVNIYDILKDPNEYNSVIYESKYILEHEVLHLVQDLIKTIYNLSDYGGLPSKRMRNLDWDSAGNKEEPEGDSKDTLKKDQKDNTKEVEKKDYELIDAEFYTLLSDSIKNFNDMTRNMDKESKKELARRFVEEPSLIIDLDQELITDKLTPFQMRWDNDFFDKLRTNEPEKWKHAVKEFYKAVL